MGVHCFVLTCIFVDIFFFIVYTLYMVLIQQYSKGD